LHAFKRYLLRRHVYNRNLRPSRLIVTVFIGVILVGAILLSLPVASQDLHSVGILKALFTSTSATCTTGLTVVDTEQHWSFFGQAVILILCQIGGLGFMSVISLFYFLLNKKIGLRERLMMMESMNLLEFEGVVRLMRHLLVGTLILELGGAVILSGCFIPDYGVADGIWRGIFMSVSAFCSAGFSNCYSDGLFSGGQSYHGNLLILITMGILIIIGSLGFYVWEDILKRKRFRTLHLHSKLVLIVTASLIVAGTLIYLLLEGRNPTSLGEMSLPRKFVVSVFQAISDRTAGFDAAGHALLREDTKLLSMLFMFIGGSSGSTAGGVKTVTVGILLLSAISVLRGRQELIIFHKKVPQTQVNQAATLVFVGIGVILTSGIIISILDEAGLFQSLYAATSAYSTAGLSNGILSDANPFLLILTMFLMFFGKIGVLSISIAFLLRQHGKIKYTYPSEKVIIG